jgi:hypothetical protein
MSANDKQVAGNHYAAPIQHWDYVVANELDYFQAQITKYVTRWKKKNGLVDLQKAQHFLEKYIEIAEPVEKAEQQMGAQGVQANPMAKVPPKQNYTLDHKEIARVLGEFSGSNGIIADDIIKATLPVANGGTASKATWYSSDKIPPRDAEGAADRNYVNQDR